MGNPKVVVQPGHDVLVGRSDDDAVKEDRVERSHVDRVDLVGVNKANRDHDDWWDEINEL